MYRTRNSKTLQAAVMLVLAQSISAFDCGGGDVPTGGTRDNPFTPDANPGRFSSQCSSQGYLDPNTVSIVLAPGQCAALPSCLEAPDPMNPANAVKVDGQHRFAFAHQSAAGEDEIFGLYGKGTEPRLSSTEVEFVDEFTTILPDGAEDGVPAEFRRPLVLCAPSSNGIVQGYVATRLENPPKLMPPGLPGTQCLWSDPNNDEDKAPEWALLTARHPNTGFDGYCSYPETGCNKDSLDCVLAPDVRTPVNLGFLYDVTLCVGGEIEKGICVIPGEGFYCGNGRVDDGEDCDDGGANVSGDLENYCAYGSRTNCNLCTHNCKTIKGKPQFCGDGQVQVGEDCDEGALNGSAACTALCQIPRSDAADVKNVQLRVFGLNEFGGVRPRITEDLETAILVETNVPTDALDVTMGDCPAGDTTCSIRATSTQEKLSWIVRLPPARVPAVGNTVDVIVTAYSQGNSGTPGMTSFEVYPKDPGLTVRCSKQLAPQGMMDMTFSLEPGSDLIEDPMTQMPYALSKMYDYRTMPLAFDENEGWVFGAPDDFPLSLFSYDVVQGQLEPGRDYQIVLHGLFDYVEPIQAGLAFSMDGGPTDVCN